MDKFVDQVSQTDHAQRKSELAYIRYADDWLIGVKGTKERGIETLKKISEFCNKISDEN